MTDNEIIKALECCGYWESDKSCEDCPANTYGFGCAQKMAKHTLDLINRQKAEIERLQKEKFDSLNSQFAEMYATTLKIATKKAKSEARKELIEKIKSKFTHKGKSTKYGEFTWDDVTSYELDNLLKEMDGEE